jgi:hypothetical protein
MRTGGNNFKDAPAVSDEEAYILDWLNLPSTVSALSLWDCLHDAHVVSIQSNLLERSMTLRCEIEHLRSFCKLADGFQFIIHLGCVQSA